MDAGAAAVLDGRQARRERSRSAIVEAMLELIREGNRRPSAVEVADRAGVSQRTLFNHFSDIQALMAEIAAAQLERVSDRMPDAPGGGTARRRSDEFFTELAPLLDDVVPVRLAAESFPMPVKPLTDGVRAVSELMRASLAATFAPELDAMTVRERDEVLDELEVLADPMAWRTRRSIQGRSRSAAAAALARSAVAVVEGHLGRDPR